MAAESYLEWLRINRRENAPNELEAYLGDGARTEGWTTEFKATAKDADYGVREALAALSNTRGGEVFIGVTDVGKVEGSPVTQEALNQTLRQIKAIPSGWRVTNLLNITGNTTEVPFAGGKRWAYVLEVRPFNLPAFVLDSEGRLILPVRSGSDTIRLDAASAIEWHTHRRRGEVLRTCHRELSTFALQLTQHSRLPEGLPDPLPYIHLMIEDGTVYNVLTESDRAELFGAGVTDGRRTGAVDSYYGAVRVIRSQLSKLPASNASIPIRMIPGLSSEFPVLRDDVRRSVDGLAAYIRSQGFVVD